VVWSGDHRGDSSANLSRDAERIMVSWYADQSSPWYRCSMAPAADTLVSPGRRSKVQTAGVRIFSSDRMAFTACMRRAFSSSCPPACENEHTKFPRT
jgi:hypothetical protein